ncbi:hypothetical protein D3C77_189640 [compost metagenome]
MLALLSGGVGPGIGEVINKGLQVFFDDCGGKFCVAFFAFGLFRLIADVFSGGFYGLG